MKDLVVHLRCLQLYAHNAHNLVGRVVFFQDHEFLSEIYTTAEADYDSVIERIIGTYGPDAIDLNEIQIAAVQKLNSYPSEMKENSGYLQTILEMEKATCQMVENLIRNSQVSVGTEQLLGNIADKSETRIYKLQQRLRK